MTIHRQLRGTKIRKVKGLKRDGACARCGRGIPGKWRGIRQRGIDKRRVRNRGKNITVSSEIRGWTKW